MKNKIASISTLSIFTERPSITKSERDYLIALSVTVSDFEGIQKEENTLMIYLNENEYLIANHDSSKRLNPIAFVDENGEIFLM